MGYNPPILDVDEKIEKSTHNLAESLSDEINLIKVKPPVDGSGIDEGPKFLDSLHIVDQEHRFLRGNKNNSPVTGFEVWYHDNKVNFIFYTPTDEIEKEYRQHINGHYEGADITSVEPKEGMFIRAHSDKNEAIAVSDLFLKKHYYHPVSNVESEASSFDQNPYKQIMNELDTRDDMRVMIQYMFKPCPQWGELPHKTLETEAERVSNMGGYQTRWFGLKIEEVDEPGVYGRMSSEMLSQKNDPAFFVNMRIALITSGETQEAARRKAKSRFNKIINAFDHAYSTKIGQTIVPRSYKTNRERNAKDTLVNMIERNARYMERPTRIHQVLLDYLTPKSKHIIMTEDELSGFVHLPSPDEITTGAISWNDTLVEGEAPPDAPGFHYEEPDDPDKIDIEKEQDIIEASETDDSIINKNNNLTDKKDNNNDKS